MILNTTGTVRKLSKLLEEAGKDWQWSKVHIRDITVVHIRTTLYQMETLNTTFA